MNKLEKRLIVFLFILSLGLLISILKVAGMNFEKKEEIGKLSLKVEDFTKKNAGLKKVIDEKEKELAGVKLDLEDLTCKLEEEKKKSESFEAKYNAEIERGNGLEADINKLKLALQEKNAAIEKLPAEVERVKKEKEALLRDLEDVRHDKEKLEAFVKEALGSYMSKGKTEVQKESELAVTKTTTTGRIVTVYPQGLLAIELEKGSSERVKPGKIVTAQREIMISDVHSHMIIIEVAEGEDITGFKKGDIIKYVR